MKTITHVRLARYTTILLLVLTCGPTLTTTAQTLASTEARFEEMQRTLTTPSMRTVLSQAQWTNYSKQLTHALASDHAGMQQGAMRMFIQYGPYLGMKRPAVFNLVRIYRNHPNDRMRRMAVVALGATNHTWAIDFLKRSAPYEQTPSVQHTILAVLLAKGHATTLGPSKATN